jgi:hypothetical protein
MRVALGSDHAGFELKRDLAAFLVQEGHVAANKLPGTHDTDDERGTPRRRSARSQAPCAHPWAARKAGSTPRSPTPESTDLALASELLPA